MFSCLRLQNCCRKFFVQHHGTHTHTESSQKDVKKKMEIKQEGKNEVRKSRAPVAAGKWKMGWGWAK